VVLLELQAEALGPADERLAAGAAVGLGQSGHGVQVANECVSLRSVNGEVEGQVGLVVHVPIIRDEDWIRVGRRSRQARGTAASTPCTRGSQSTAPIRSLIASA
jgi:hypothetical protein